MFVWYKDFVMSLFFLIRKNKNTRQCINLKVLSFCHDHISGDSMYGCLLFSLLASAMNFLIAGKT